MTDAKQTPRDNPDRPTPTSRLWAIGAIGGFVLAVVIVMQAQPGATAQEMTAGYANIAKGALFVALAIGGGWRALRRSKP